MAATRKLILASSSPYRQALLARLGIPFTCISPAVDEAPNAGESPAAQVLRLAQTKAERIATGHANALIIGSDQLAVLDGRTLGKPGAHPAARAQLLQMRGRRVLFMTGLCVLDTATGKIQTDLVEYAVIFRDYSDEEVERYLRADTPYDCSGSFRSEKLGITLVQRMDGADPTALVGLPLIRLSQMLRDCGVPLP